MPRQLITNATDAATASATLVALRALTEPRSFAGLRALVALRSLVAFRALVAFGVLTSFGALGPGGGVAHAQPSPAPAPGSSDPASGAAPSAPAAPADPGAGTPASGTPATPGVVEPAPGSSDVGDQAISAELGLAGGGRVTPGGLRLAGQFLYQLSDDDWFDGGASFTFGSGSPACFRDRMDKVICSHGLADGAGIELTASVRRMFTPQGAFHPFARVGVGIGVVRFDRDDVTGITIPAHAGGGVRVAVSHTIAIIAEADLQLGFSSLTRNIGTQPQFGLAIGAGAEFRLR
jgi:opacity protein-like surface antigen